MGFKIYEVIKVEGVLSEIRMINVCDASQTQTQSVFSFLVILYMDIISFKLKETQQTPEK